MSTCARCGLPEAEEWPHDDDKVCFRAHGYEVHTIECLERQIAAQAALLRSVTGKLEEAASMLSDIDAVTCGQVGEPLTIISQVLEVLS